MAKRRRLGPPDPAQIAQLNAAAPPAAGAAPPPIARVAADAAARAAGEIVEARRAAAESEAAAAQWRAAEAEGRVVKLLPLSAIDVEHLTRDRVASDPEEAAELKASIRAHGVRTPIEVLASPEEGGRYGLISGWRRVNALRALWSETGAARFATAPAFVRAPEGAAEAYVAMVEENEVRADLSHYERGRIAAVAAGRGAFPSVDAAVAALFGAGSKAKRSKIRSFALIHEALGDVLAAGPAIGERLGLKIAQMIKEGRAAALRDALGADGGRSASEETALLERLARAAPVASAPPRRRRPATGVALEARLGADGATLRLTGAAVDQALLDRVVAAVAAALQDPRA